MRTREEIVDSFIKTGTPLATLEVMLEVLLDIRELLIKKDY